MKCQPEEVFAALT